MGRWAHMREGEQSSHSVKKRKKSIVLDIGDTDVYKAYEDFAFMKYVFYGREVPSVQLLSRVQLFATP